MEGFQARLEQQGLVKKVVAPRADAPAAVKSSTSVQSTVISAQLVHQHWKDVDLDGKRKAWEESCLDIANAQEASSTSRKALAENTKDFRKKTDEEKLEGWGTFLKSYQAEIDSLTKRSKAAEMAFLNAYKVMREVPDPTLTLGAMLEELSAVMPLQAQYDKLEAELHQYEEEFSKLKNQDVTIRKLEDRIGELEEQSEDTIAAALERERARLEEHSSKLAADQDRRGKELQGKLDEQKAVNFDLRRQYDETQTLHLELQMRFERDVQAKQQQLDLVSEDLERSMARAEALEKEKEGINAQYMDLWKKQYQKQDASSREDQSTVTVSSSRIAELETTMAGKEALCKQLQLQVGMLQEALEGERATARDDAERGAVALAEREAEAASLKKRIRELPTTDDYQKVKRQLRVMQAVEYNMLDSEALEGGSANSPEEDGEGAGESLRLEEMLLTKNQQLERRLAEANRLMDGKLEEVRLLLAREGVLESKTSEQAALITRLEEDLMRASDGEREKKGEGFGSERLTALLVQPSEGREGHNVEGSLATAVALQRDRFRQLNAELEGENAVLKKRVGTCEGDIRSLRGDNVKMYEKIKFLESCKPGQGSGRAGQQSDVESSIDAMPNVERYKSAYEDSINPFTVFNQKQRQLRREKMDPAERVLLEASQFFLGHASARKFLFFYMVVMHFLVFSTLYNFTHTHERCKKLAAQALDLPAAAAAQHLVRTAQKQGVGVGPRAAQVALDTALKGVQKGGRRLMAAGTLRRGGWGGGR